ncbi:hypothetical protein ACWDE9_18895 [Streptomyces olivaceoviridis]
MIDFQTGEGSIAGSPEESVEWVNDSSLSSHHKELLLRFVHRFPGLGFIKDSGRQRLRRLEQEESVVLPPWLYEIRRTLYFVASPVQVCFDDFDSYTPRADYVNEIWYSMEVIHMGDEQRELFVAEARVYPIGEWEEGGRSFLAVSLAEPSDVRIYEFAAQDLLDNVLDGKPAGVSVRPAFDSYPSMLSHVISCRLPDGTVIEAR